MNETAWAPALVVLAAAIVVGTAIALRTRTGRALPSTSTTQRDDLLRQKDAAYTLIREHRAARAQQEPGPWLDELHRLEREAADVLRALDALAPAQAAAPPPPREVSVGVRAAQWVGAAAFFAALTFVLRTYTAERAEGGSVTGGGAMANGAAAREEAAIAGLRAAVAANPTDIAAKNRLGHALLNRQELMDAYALAEEVVAVSADDAEARTHQAVALVAMGDPKLAAGVLDRVLATHPAFAEALGWRGALHYQTGELDAAAAVWERAIAADPSLTPTLRPLVDAARDPAKAAEIKAQLAARQAAAGAQAAAGPMQGGATEGGPMRGGPMQGGAAAPDPADVVGEVRGDAAALRAGDILFLSARPEGVTAGPPLWVQRIPLTTLPYAFRLGPGSAMLGGQTLPAKVVITARVDRDRDPTTRGPDDLEGRTEPTAPGTTGVVIALAGS